MALVMTVAMLPSITLSNVDGNPMDGNYQQWGPFWLSGSMLRLSKGEGLRIYRYR